MSFLKTKNWIASFASLKFALWILFIIGILGAVGSVVEQNESLSYYQENYPISKPVYNFITWQFILQTGTNHIFQTWWFFFFVFTLGACLASCTFLRQFPAFLNAKQPLWVSEKFFKALPISTKSKNIFYFKENFIKRISLLNFYGYQKRGTLFCRKGLVGKVSPMLVHFSMLIVLGGSLVGALKSFKAQEILPKGELFHVQNGTTLNSINFLKKDTLRLNDFWGESKKNRIRQFYSSLSIINCYGTEVGEQTISVNNPLKQEYIDFYQSDWSFLGIRLQKPLQKFAYERPLWSIRKGSKIWGALSEASKKPLVFVFSKLQSNFLIYDSNGMLLSRCCDSASLNNYTVLIQTLPAAGLFIKKDASVFIVYFGFGLLLVTIYLSYLPYAQLWVLREEKNILVGAKSNRGKAHLEVQSESLLRVIEIFYNKSRKE